MDFCGDKAIPQNLNSKRVVWAVLMGGCQSYVST